MVTNYKTNGTCSKNIEIEHDNGIILNVKFTGGCNGNLQGISALVRGKTFDEVIAVLKGIKCGFKSTSCPDQLATALEKLKNQD